MDGNTNMNKEFWYTLRFVCGLIGVITCGYLGTTLHNFGLGMLCVLLAILLPCICKMEVPVG